MKYRDVVKKERKKGCLSVFALAASGVAPSFVRLNLIRIIAVSSRHYKPNPMTPIVEAPHIRSHVHGSALLFC